MDVNREVRGLRMKLKQQNGKGGSVGCGGVVIKHSLHCFTFVGFWETVPTICASPNSLKWFNGPLPGPSRNRSPYRPFITAIGYYSPNIHRLHCHLLRLSNRYFTTITPVFSPQFDFADTFTCGSGTTPFLRLGSPRPWGLSSVCCCF